MNAGRKTLRDIARDIAGRSSLTRGDIENVLANFTETIKPRLTFTPGVELKAALRETSYETIREKAAQQGDGSGEEEENP